MVLKTQQNKASVSTFLSQVGDKQQQKDSKELLKIFQAATKKKPMMWGKTIVGFGSYHYKYASGREGDWMMTGFSPRKGSISLYIMPGFKKYQALLKKLGTHKVSGGCCLYIKKLDDVKVEVLKQLITTSFNDMKKRYETK